MKRAVLLFALFLICLPLLQGCTCCVYYNHMFNAERAWAEGVALQKARHDSLPADTTWVTMAERVKFDRVIEKCSRVLERFPDDMDSKPQAVFMIGESFRKKGEWNKAIVKYDEFERYFSGHDSMPTVEYQRAFCLFKNNDYAVARFALERVLAKGEVHPYHLDALQLLALLDEQSSLPDQAIASLEKVLASGAGTPFLRGKMRIRLAELYYRQESWAKALEHYQASEISVLDLRDRMLASIQSVECLARIGRALEAIALLERLEKAEGYETQVPELRVRRGELLLDVQSHEKGLSLLLGVVKTNPKTNPASRAWFAMGDWEQMKRKNYPLAMQHFDSAWATWPASQWGKQAKLRKEALYQLLALQAKGADSTSKKLSRKEEFQIAELFLFKLTEVDSAIHVLDRIADGVQDRRDSSVLQRAFYARAFIYDEFKRDSLKADSLYRDLIKRFPGTSFAQQAQANLGERVTEKTREDLAYQALLQAESLWVALSSLPPEDTLRIDSLVPLCQAAYDSVAKAYPETAVAARALFAKAWIYENYIGEIDSAKVTYDLLRNRYGSTEQGRAALEKMQPRLRITDQELDRLRKRVLQNEATAERLSRQYQEEIQKKREAEKNKKPEETSVDEVLENDYNSLYDFQ